MNRRLARSGAALALCVALLLSSLSGCALFTNDTVVRPDEKKLQDLYARLVALTKDTGTYGENSYYTYTQSMQEGSGQGNEIILPGSSGTPSADADVEKAASFEGKNDVLLWHSETGEVEYEFEAEYDGWYALEFSYYQLESLHMQIEFGLLLDGILPFEEADTLVLDRPCVNIEGQQLTDELGNDVRPRQVEAPAWLKTSVSEWNGVYNGPFMFRLTPGKHTLTLISEKACFAIESIRFYEPEDIPGHAEYAAAIGASTASIGFSEKIQGEAASRKSDITLSPTYDRSSYLTYPSHPTKMRYNTIGQNTWMQSGQWIEWTINVPSDGYYKIGARARQDVQRGFVSSREITIDGKVPFQEFSIVEFPYSTEWYFTEFGDEDSAVWLEAGEHTLRMRAVPGSVGESLRRVEDVIYILNLYYRKMLMITGQKPDRYQDYYLDVQIPELMDVLSTCKDLLYMEKDMIESITGQRGSEAVALEKMCLLLDMCVDDPDKIPNEVGQPGGYSSNWKNNISQISEWMLMARAQPLEIDYIEVVSADTDFTSAKENFFSSLGFGVLSFFGSFSEDYTSLGVKQKKAVDVWVATGRDQAQVIKELIDSYFTPNHDVSINLNLVPGSLLEATLAGKGPDIAINIGQDTPIQLAVRGLTYDISQFEDFPEVYSRFPEESWVHYTSDGGIYALPLTRQVPMMFYREDILDEIGIREPPLTWDEFRFDLTLLQRKYMDVSLVMPTDVIMSTTEAGHMFATLLLQRGLSYYEPNLQKTTFDTPSAVDAFKIWTDFYTDYNLPRVYNFYQRFRTGEMPIGIMPYTFYTQLEVSAPELKGLWGMTTIPGTEQADGSINIATNSTGAGIIMFEKTEDKDAAWEFLKWFTSTDIQVLYGRSLEALMGPMGRYDSTNMDVIRQLPWSLSDYTALSTQVDALKEIPIIPASYAVTRGVANAFRMTVYSYEMPRETLIQFNRDINLEIKRKNEEIASFN